MGDARAELAGIVRESGLIEPGARGVVLVSGGPDSACAAAGVAGLSGPEALVALHLNYGLRPDSGEDEAVCAELCQGLGVRLEVERPELGEGNVQALAREARYAAAERLAESTGAAWIATGHTRTDLAETLIYRLATSPGRRALLGLPERRGRIVRPLLALDRPRARELAGAAGLPFRDDPSNIDPDYARNRIRHEVLPVLLGLSPAAEQAIAETRAELAEEAEVLDRVVAEALAAAGAGEGLAAVSADTLVPLEPGLRRLCLRALAERAAGRPVALGRDRAERIMRLAASPEGGKVELGGGVSAVCEYGFVRFQRGAGEGEPEPSRLGVPGSCRFGGWEVRAELAGAPVEPAGPELATLDAEALGAELVVRAWREGDRMRPLGLGGTKTLQDLFSDARVPRSLRRTLPVVAAGEEIAWVAGVAVSEEFRITDRTRRVAVLTARQT